MTDDTGRLMVLYVLRIFVCIFVYIYTGTHLYTHACMCVVVVYKRKKLFPLLSNTSDIKILFLHHAVRH